MLKRKFSCCLGLALWLLPLAGRAAETVTINGFPAYTGTVLAKAKRGELAAQGLRALNVPGGSVQKVIENVPGLVVLQRERRGDLRALTEEQERVTLEAWIAELKATGAYDYVEPDYQVHTYAAPTDAAFVDGRLWGLQNFGQNGGVTGADISATNSWDLTTGSASVLVGVIDSGVRYTHQDLAAQMWTNPGEIPNNNTDDDNDGYIDNVYGIDAFNNDGDPNDDNDHGTHVAGTIGAAANDGNPHVGVAWQVRLMALKFLCAQGNGPTSGAIDCINFAIRHNVRILNNSWGGGGYSQALFDTILASRNAGILFVAAAGNESNNNDLIRAYPASYDIDSIIAVAAVDRIDRLADFSNYGRTTVHLGAPGVDIFSSISTADNAYDTFQGTSMASPHVAGVAALVAAYVPAASYLDIKSRITNGVVKLPSLEGRTITGGRLNAFRALTRGIDGVLEVAVTPAPDTQITAGTQDVPIYVDVSDGVAVTNATVVATVNGATLTFSNNGQSPDQTAEDGTYTALFDVPAMPGVVTFDLRISAAGKTNFSQTFSYNVVVRPGNDGFANPTKVPASGGTFEQNAAFSTLEPDERRHAGTNTLGSVWYAWSLERDANVIVDAAGTLYPVAIAVYTNTALSNIVEIASATSRTNALGRTTDPWVKFFARSNVTYKIAFAQISSNATTLNARFEIDGEPDRQSPLLTITNLLSGSVLSSDRIHLGGTIIDPIPNASGVAEVQLLVRIPGGGNIVERVIPVTGQRADWYDEAGLLLQPGRNIVEAYGFDKADNVSARRALDLYYLSFTNTPNDLFVFALPLTNQAGIVVVSTSAATKEANEPAHAGNEGGRSVWYRFTPVEDGVLFLSTAGSLTAEGQPLDTLLGVYAGTNVARLTTLASNDDIPGDRHSELIVGVQAGQTYRIAVDSFDATPGNARLIYNFNPSPVFRVSVESRGNGSVTPQSGLYPANATVSLLATADPYFQFLRFETAAGAVVSTNNPFNLLVTAAIDLVAVFGARDFADDFESGDFSRLSYTNQGWLITDLGVSDRGGRFAARSSAQPTQHRITNILSVATLPSGGIGSFDLRTSTEQNYDRLEFYVISDSRADLLGTWSGETPWTTYRFQVPAGPGRLEWRYVKDAALSAGMDAVFINNMSLPAVAVAQADVQIAVAAGTGQLTILGEPMQSYRIEASKDLVHWTVLTAVATDQGGTAHFVDPSGSTQRFYRVRPN